MMVVCVRACVRGEEREKSGGGAEKSFWNIYHEMISSLSRNMKSHEHERQNEAVTAPPHSLYAPAEKARLSKTFYGLGFRLKIFN